MNDIEERVDRLEEKVGEMNTIISAHGEHIIRFNRELDDLDKKASVSDAILVRVEQAFNKAVDAISSNSRVINGIEKTLIAMQGQINSNAEITVQIKNQVNRIESNFLVSEDKAKLDFRDIVKDLVKSRVIWLIGGGVFTAFIALLIAIIENFDKILLMFNK